MQEAEPRLAIGRQLGVISARRFKHRIGAHDIGTDEIARAVNRTVDMGFRRQMHHGIRLEFGEKAHHRRLVGDVTFGKSVACAVVQAAQIFRRSRVGKLVDVEDAMLSIAQDFANNR